MDKRFRVVAPLLVFALTALFILACSGSDAANTGTATNGTVTAPATKSHFKVGQQVKVGDTWLITVNSAKTNKGTDFDQPKQGSIYLVIDVSMKNLSSKEEDVSSLAQFSLKDATGQQYTEAITSFGHSLDGKVEAGGLLRGQLIYEVPTSQHQFTLAFESDLLSSGQTIWDISL